MRSTQSIPTSVTLTNNTTQRLNLGGLILEPSQSGKVVDTTKYSGATDALHGDSPRARVWNAIVLAARTTATRASAPVTIVATTPSLTPANVPDYVGFPGTQQTRPVDSALRNALTPVPAPVLRNGSPADSYQRTV